jgi:hypothetical protein
MKWAGNDAASGPITSARRTASCYTSSGTVSRPRSRTPPSACCTSCIGTSNKFRIVQTSTDTPKVRTHLQSVPNDLVAVQTNSDIDTRRTAWFGSHINGRLR